MEAFTEAYVEVTSVEASTTKFRGSFFHGSFHASMEASMAAMEAFMSFHQKCRQCRWPRQLLKLPGYCGWANRSSASGTLIKEVDHLVRDSHALGSLFPGMFLSSSSAMVVGCFSKSDLSGRRVTFKQPDVGQKHVRGAVALV